MFFLNHTVGPQRSHRGMHACCRGDSKPAHAHTHGGQKSHSIAFQPRNVWGGWGARGVVNTHQNKAGRCCSKEAKWASRKSRAQSRKLGVPHTNLVLELQPSGRAGVGQHGTCGGGGLVWGEGGVGQAEQGTFPVHKVNVSDRRDIAGAQVP